MIRNVSLNEISDGRLYDLNDMVKVDCNGCQGCSSCCQGMGNSIILDPLDIYQLTGNLSQSFNELLNDRIELNVVDGIILPNLNMHGASERCVFLNSEDRCSIHAFNHQFVNNWHYLLKDIQQLIESSQDEKFAKDINMYLLNAFYIKSYDYNTDFYIQFNTRYQDMIKLISVLSSNSN